MEDTFPSSLRSSNTHFRDQSTCRQEIQLSHSMGHMECGCTFASSGANESPTKFGIRKCFVDEAAMSSSWSSWSHIDLSLAGHIQTISSLIPVEGCQKWPEVVPIQSATSGTIMNSLNRVVEGSR
nr:hypothetical transcript [Hymenolepis microstoma]